METLKKAVRRAAINSKLKTIQEVLKEFFEQSNEDLDDFNGRFDELILVQAIKVLRERNALVLPEAMEEFNHLVELVKNIEEIKEVKENEHKEVLCRTNNTRK